MLNSAIGEDAFRQGLQAYLKKFAYQNTFSKDLWACFSEASGTDVASMMSAWTQKIGKTQAHTDAHTVMQMHEEWVMFLFL
jgi:aminopeptidase N